LRLTHLQLENFRSHEKLDLDLAMLDCAAIVGPNGAGKSSLLLAVDFALYGGSADELISRSADRGAVTLEVEQDGIRWRVNRGRERGRKSWLVVESSTGPSGFKPIAMRTIAESQALIEEMITGMDGDAFTASIYAPQGEAGLLAAMGPGKRKQLLGGLLGLERYEDWRESASQDARDAASRADSARVRIEGIEEQLGAQEELIEDDGLLSMELEHGEESHETAEEELDAAIEREKAVEQVNRRRQLITQMNGVRERGKQAKENERRLFEARNDMTGLEGIDDVVAGEREKKALVDAARAAADARREAQGEAYRAAEKALEAAQGEVGTAARQVEQAEERCSGIKFEITAAEQPGARCPTCNQEVDIEHRAAALDVLATRLTAAKTDLSDATEGLMQRKRAVEAAVAHEEEVARGAVAVDDPVPFDAAHLEALEARQRFRDRLEGTITELEGHETAADLKEEWDRLKGEAEELPAEVPVGPSTASCRETVRELERAITDLQQRIAASTNARDSVRILEEKAVEYRKSAAAADVDARALAVLAKAFSREGIPAMILDNAVGVIEAGANEVLDQLDSSMSIRLATQRQTKSGSLSETLDILVDDGTMERPLETYSGGEQYRIHLALRLGIAGALQRQELDCLLIDEPTDLDAAGVAMLAEMLTKLPHQVLLVSHQVELVDALPQRLVVSRASSASPSEVELV
jgi:DNA repair exonuclease SbcCD ATPase subunit